MPELPGIDSGAAIPSGTPRATEAALKSSHHDCCRCVRQKVVSGGRMIPQPQDAEPSFTQARDQQTAQRSAADGDPNASTQAGAPSTSIPAALPLAASQRYALGDEIARGGMGVIYRATDMALGRDVAVKMLQAKFALDSGVARRFAAEARITAQLQHPGIPPVHDCGRMPDGRPFLSMKL